MPSVFDQVDQEQRTQSDVPLLNFPETAAPVVFKDPADYQPVQQGTYDGKFTEAFKKARADYLSGSGDKTFIWSGNGQPYTVELASDAAPAAKPVAAPAPAAKPVAAPAPAGKKSAWEPVQTQAPATQPAPTKSSPLLQSVTGTKPTFSDNLRRAEQAMSRKGMSHPVPEAAVAPKGATPLQEMTPRIRERVESEFLQATPQQRYEESIGTGTRSGAFRDMDTQVMTYITRNPHVLQREVAALQANNPGLTDRQWLFSTAKDNIARRLLSPKHTEGQDLERRAEERRNAGETEANALAGAQFDQYQNTLAREATRQLQGYEAHAEQRAMSVLQEGKARERAADPRVQFGEEHPILGAATGSLASMVAGFGGNAEWAQNVAREADKITPAVAKMSVEEAWDSPHFSDWLKAATAQMLPQAVPSVIAAMSGNPALLAGYVTAMAGSAGGNKYRQNIESGMPADRAALNATWTAVAEGVPEFIGIKALQKASELYSRIPAAKRAGLTKKVGAWAAGTAIAGFEEGTEGAVSAGLGNTGDIITAKTTDSKAPWVAQYDKGILDNVLDSFIREAMGGLAAGPIFSAGMIANANAAEGMANPGVFDEIKNVFDAIGRDPNGGEKVLQVHRGAISHLVDKVREARAAGDVAGATNALQSITDYVAGVARASGKPLTLLDFAKGVAPVTPHTGSQQEQEDPAIAEGLRAAIEPAAPAVQDPVLSVAPEMADTRIEPDLMAGPDVGEAAAPAMDDTGIVAELRRMREQAQPQGEVAQPSEQATLPPESSAPSPVTSPDVQPEAQTAPQPAPAMDSPTPEAQVTIDAQARAVADPENPKQTMFIPAGSPQPSEGILPAEAMIIDLGDHDDGTPIGLLVTTNPTVARRATVAAETGTVTEGAMGKWLGMPPGGKPYGEPAAVVQARTATPEGVDVPVTEVAVPATPAGIAAGQEAVAGQGEETVITSPEAAVAERAMLVEAAQPQDAQGSLPRGGDTTLNVFSMGRDQDQAAPNVTVNVEQASQPRASDPLPSPEMRTVDNAKVLADAAKASEAFQVSPVDLLPADQAVQQVLDATTEQQGGVMTHVALDQIPDDVAPSSVTPDGQRVYNLSRDDAEYISILLEALGQEAVFYVGDQNAADGLHLPGKKFIKINNSTIPQTHVAGHEFFHQVERGGGTPVADAYDMVMGGLGPKGVAEYMGATWYDFGAVRSEATADIAGGILAPVFTRAGFWGRVFTGVEQQHGVNKAKRIIRNFSRQVGEKYRDVQQAAQGRAKGYDTDQMLNRTGLAAARVAVGDAVRAYITAQSGPLAGEMAGMQAQRDLGVQLSNRRFSLPRRRDTRSALENALVVANSKTWQKGRDLKDAIQQFAPRINVDNMSPEERAAVVEEGYQDALFGLEQNPNAVGWYDLKTRQALAVMALVHPELITDENARFAFTWALAVTSNGLKVDKNFKLAEAAYRRYKQTGMMPTDIQAGQAQAAINDSLALFNDLRDSWGIDALREFMLTNFTVGEIGALSKDLKPGGEHVDVEVKGAAILGPKIGNGFFSNLYGNFDSLTMDRWLVRTWGRWTGTLLKPDPENTAKAASRLQRAALEVPQSVKKTLEGVIDHKLDTDDMAALADAIHEASTDPDKRKQMNETQGGEELRKAGNSLWKYLDGQKEAPSGPTERKVIRSVFGDILAKVQSDPAYADLTMADLQAALWYAEKRLYETAKSKEILDDEDDVSGYTDDEAPDYANAATTVALEQGVTRRRIDNALKREEQNGRSRAARPEDGGGQGQGPGAATGRASPGFTGKEKRAFIRARAVHRVRSSVAGDEGQSGSYLRRSGEDGGRPRLLKALGVTYVAQWKPTKTAGNIFRANDMEPSSFLELEPTQANAAKFRDLISASRASLGDFGAAVYVYPEAEYAGMKLLLTPDGKAGVAVKPDGDIVSVFGSGHGDSIVQAAISAGGRKLDGFDTILGHLYGTHGFRVAARLLWDDTQAPPDWNKSTFKPYNNGEPDVLFMVYDPDYYGHYTKKDGRKATSYDQALRAQRKLVKELHPSASKVKASLPRFFSPLAKAVAGARMEQQPAQQWKLWIAGNKAKLGVKDEEIQWSGLFDYLDLRGKDKVTKAEIAGFLSENGVRVDEVVLGEDVDWAVYDPIDREEYYFGGEAEARQYAADNGIPSVEVFPKKDRGNPAKHASGNLVLPGGTDHREIVLTVPTIEPYNESDTTHYGDTGKGKAIAWARVNSRVDADGRKVLFVEEIQSQRNQHGRKNGFAARRELSDSEKQELRQLERERNRTPEQQRRMNELDDVVMAVNVPTAPFVSTKDGKPVDSYIALTLKRLIAYAVDSASDSWRMVSKPYSAREELQNNVNRELAGVIPLEFVDAPMLSALKNDKVRQAVVELIPVDVVNILTANGINAEDVFNNRNVFSNPLPAESRATVAAGVLSALELVGTRLRAALLRVLTSESGRGDKELTSAIRAVDLSGREVYGLLSTSSPSIPSGGELISVLGGSGLGSTRSSAKPSVAVSDGARVGGKLSTAELTSALNRHNDLLKANGLDYSTEYDSGYQVISWTRGDQQADRYDLSKQLDTVLYDRSPNGGGTVIGRKGGSQEVTHAVSRDEDVADVVGKDVAAKLLEAPKNMYGFHELSGLDLKVGGGWTASMYGNASGLDAKGKPSMIAAAARKLGAEVGSVSLESGREGGKSFVAIDENGERHEFSALWKAEKFVEENPGAKLSSLDQPGFPITDKMREQVATGMPLFSLPRTVKVDGKDRPTTNSNGQPIHPTAEGVRNFWKWFGDSKVVDDQGRPLVVYHGTGADFSEFSDENAPYRGGLLAFFAEQKSFANRYAGKEGSVYPVYLKIETLFDHRTKEAGGLADDFMEFGGGITEPAERNRILMGLGEDVEDIFDDTHGIELTADMFVKAVKNGSWDAIENNEFVEWLNQQEGVDGVLMVEGGSITYGVFDPTQIKSAIGNIGEFDGANPDIRYSLPRKTPRQLRRSMAERIGQGDAEKTDYTDALLEAVEDDFQAGERRHVSHEKTDAQAEALARRLGRSVEDATAMLKMGTLDVGDGKGAPAAVVMGAAAAIARVAVADLMANPNDPKFAENMAGTMNLLLASWTNLSEIGRALNYAGALQRPASSRSKQQKMDHMRKAMDAAKDAASDAVGVAPSATDEERAAVGAYNKVLGQIADTTYASEEAKEELVAAAQELEQARAELAKARADRDAAKKALSDAERAKREAEKKSAEAGEKTPTAFEITQAEGAARRAENEAAAAKERAAFLAKRLQEAEETLARVKANQPSPGELNRALGAARRAENEAAAAKERLAAANAKLRDAKKRESEAKDKQPSKAEITRAEGEARRAENEAKAAVERGREAARRLARARKRIQDAAGKKVDADKKRAQAEKDRTRIKALLPKDKGGVTPEEIEAFLGGPKGVAKMQAAIAAAKDLDPNHVTMFLQGVAGSLFKAKQKRLESRSGTGRAITNTLDMALELFRAMLLTGFRTHLTNIFSNAAFQVIDAGLTRGLANALPGGSGAKAHAKAMGKALVYTMSRALPAINYAITQEYPAAHFKAFTEAPADLRNALLDLGGNKWMDDKTAAIPGALGKLVRSVGFSPLGAEDAFFKLVPYTYSIALDTAMGKPVDYTKAVELAEYETFQTSLSEGMAKWQGAIHKTHFLGFVVPYFKTLINLINRTFDYTPGISQVKNWNNLAGRNGVEARNLALAQGVVGAGLALVAFMLHGADDDEREQILTGMAPRDYNEKQWWLVDNDPIALRFGDWLLGMARVEPFASQLGLSMAMADAAGKAGKGDYAGAGDLLGDAMAAVVLDKSFMKGLNDVSEAITDTDKRSRYLTETLPQSILFGMFVPNLINQTGDVMDQYKRDAEGWKEKFQSRIPIWREELYPATNAVGQPLQNPGYLNPTPFTLAKKPVNETADWLRDNGIGMQAKPKRVKDIPDKSTRRDLLEQRADRLSNLTSREGQDAKEAAKRAMRKWSPAVTRARREYGLDDAEAVD